MLVALKEQSLAAVLAVLGIAARIALSVDPPTPLRVVRQVIAGAFVGAAVAAALADYGLAAPTKGAIVGVSAMIAEDLLRYLMAVVAQLTADPDCLIQALRRRWRLDNARSTMDGAQDRGDSDRGRSGELGGGESSEASSPEDEEVEP